MKWLLYIALLISIITYNTWMYLPKGSFYIGNAIFISMICGFIYINYNKYWISFLLFYLSLNNLVDELFFDNTKIQLNELFFTLIILYFIYKNYARKKPANNR